MRHILFICIVLSLCILPSCESDYNPPIQSYSNQKHTTNYYQEATQIFSSIVGKTTRSSTPPISPVLPPQTPITPDQYSRYLQYGENIENILVLSDSELESLCQNAKYQEMCQEVEEEVDEALSNIYDYMSIEDFKSCEEVIINYVEAGGHNSDLLDDLTCEMGNENAYKLACFSAALFDTYVGEGTDVDFNGQDIVSDLQQASCEKIRAVKIAILQVELTGQYLINLGFTVANPIVGAGGFAVSCFYGLATYAMYEVEYRNCVKKRNNSGKK